MEDNLMGLFFKDLKDDLSESVNNLPDDTNKASDDSDDVMVNTLDVRRYFFPRNRYGKCV